MTRKNKGYVLITDALVALFFGIIIFTTLLALDFSNIKMEFTEFLELHYVSEDTFDVMNKKGTLDQVGHLWSISGGNRSSPAWSNMTNLTRYHLERLVPPRMGYKMFVDDIEIYNSSWNPNRTREADSVVETHASRFLVGYGENMTVLGKTARAYLSKIKGKTTSAYAYFGGFVGQGNLSRELFLPSDASVQSAYIEVNVGSDFDLYINGAFCKTFNVGPSTMNASVKDAAGDITSCNNSITNKGSIPNIFEIFFINNNVSQHYIGGGFIEVTYNTTQMDTDVETGTMRFYLPKIHGIINYYSSFYVPGPVTAMKSNITFKNNFTTFFTVGNTTIFMVNGSPTKQSVYNGSLMTILASSAISEETVPIRIGTGDMQVTLVGVGDIMVSTDLTTHMVWGGDPWRLNAAKAADKHLIDIVLNASGNRVGLNGFCTIDGWQNNCGCPWVNANFPTKGCTLTQCYVPAEGCGIRNHHDLSDDNVSLKTHVDTYAAPGSCCGPCISCAINKSRQMFLAQSDCSRKRFMVVMSSPCGNDLGTYAPEEVYHGGWTTGKVDSALDFEGGDNYVNITDTDFYFNTNLTIEMWIKPSIVSTNNTLITSGFSGVDPWWHAVLDDGDIRTYFGGGYNTTSVGILPNQWYHILFTVGTGTINAGSLYVDGVLKGNFDRGVASGTGTYIGRHRPGYPYTGWFNGIIDEVRVYNRTLNATEIGWSYQRGLAGLKSNVSSTGLVGQWYLDGDASDSSGNANHGTLHGFQKGWAVEAADQACADLACLGNDLNIYTISFGVEGAPSPTLVEVARRCGNGTFYSAANLSELYAVYEEIGGKIYTASYSSQIIVPTIGEMVNSTLYGYPESYIEFTYTPHNVSGYGKISITKKSERFNEPVKCVGNISIPGNVTVSSMKVTSYSGDHWTHYLNISNSKPFTEPYKLWEAYPGVPYIHLGDPYIVHVNQPWNLINPGECNLIGIRTGDTPANDTGCSADDRAIYTVRVSSILGYGDVLPTNEGCLWDIEFSSGTTVVNLSIPSYYVGTRECSYTSSNQSYDGSDAAADAVFRLLRELDIEDDGVVDVDFDSDALQFDTSAAGKVRSLWGPIKMILVIWS